MNSLTKSGVIGLLFAFTFQTAILYAEQNDLTLGNPGDRPLPTRPISPEGAVPPNTDPALAPWRDSLLPGDNPLQPPDVGPGPTLKIQPFPPVKEIVRPPLPIKPSPPPREIQKPQGPDTSKLEELAREYERQSDKKKTTKKKITNRKFIRAKSNDREIPEVLAVQSLSATPESLAIKAIFAGLDPSMDISALLRSSADMDLADHRVFRMDCKNDSCTALMQGLDPATSYYLSFLLKAPDSSDELFYELISRNIAAHTLSTSAPPPQEIVAKIKQIFLAERPEKQIPIDENSVVIAPDQSPESCTAVAVCARSAYNVTAQSQSGNERFVGTVALFDGGSAKHYVSRFRFQKKSPSAPLSAIL